LELGALGEDLADVDHEGGHADQDAAAEQHRD
jgi:hypothetical protein